MIRGLSLFIFAVALIAVLPARATSEPRHVHLEWEPDSEAQTYELEIGHQGAKELAVRRTGLKTSQWNGEFRPGKYWMRIRGRDDRSLAGDWSDKIEFEVKVPAPDLVTPAAGATISAQTANTDLQLKWNAVVGVKSYTVFVYDKDQKTVAKETVSESAAKVSLRTAAAYTWSVQATDDRGNQSELPKTKQAFSLQGPASYQPALKIPESEFVRQIELSASLPEQAVAKVVVERFDPKTGQWIKVLAGKMHKGRSIPFQAKLPGGHYRVSTITKEPLRAPSSVSSVDFEAVDGPRTQAVESRALIRQSIERTNTWFSQASYIVSSVDYDASIISANQTAHLHALSSGLNFGLGKFWKNSPWGVYGGGEINTLKVSGTQVTSPGLQLAGLYGIPLQRESELRFRFGLFNRSIPQIRGVYQNADLENINVYGPLAGVDYWYSLSPKVALELSTLFRMNMAGHSSYGGDVHANLNYQAGLMGGYRFTKSLTTLAGYSYHHDEVQVNDWNKNLGISGTDKINMSGHYLQMSVEYAF